MAKDNLESVSVKSVSVMFSTRLFCCEYFTYSYEKGYTPCIVHILLQAKKKKKSNGDHEGSKVKNESF